MLVQSFFFEKINKYGKPLTRLNKKGERTQINKTRNERGQTATDIKEIERIVRKYYKQLHTKKSGQPGKDGSIPRKIKSSRTKSGRIREFE